MPCEAQQAQHIKLGCERQTVVDGGDAGLRRPQGARHTQAGEISLGVCSRRQGLICVHAQTLQCFWTLAEPDQVTNLAAHTV